MHEALESITVFTLDWRASLFFHSYEEEVASPAVPFTCLWQSCWRSERRERFEQIQLPNNSRCTPETDWGMWPQWLSGKGLAFALKWKSAALFLFLAVLLMWHKYMPGSHSVYVSVLYLSEGKKIKNTEIIILVTDKLDKWAGYCTAASWWRIWCFHSQVQSHRCTEPAWQ